MRTSTRLAAFAIAGLLMVPSAARAQRADSAGSPPASAAAAISDDPRVAALLADLLPNAGGARLRQALAHIGQTRDKRFIGPLIDMLRFMRRHPEYATLLRTLRTVSDASLARDETPWAAYVRWYGAQEDLVPPPGYTAWKGELFAQLVDPRFREFLYEGVRATVRVEEVVWGGVRVDGLIALAKPRFVAANRATYLSPEDVVFGVSLNGDDRAYPLRILDSHEMANDVVGGRPVALAYCTLCGAGVLYDAVVGGEPYDFGSSGLLYRSNKLMYDRQTRTLWNHFTGEPVIGPLVGRDIRLNVLPLVCTSWGEWRRLHPDTKVLDINTGHARPYDVGAYYGKYFASSQTMFPVWRTDDRRAAKSRVYVVRHGDKTRAYPLDVLRAGGVVVNDTLGGEPIVVVHRDAVPQVPLSDAWRRALRGPAGGATEAAEVALANDLSLDAVRRALRAEPALAREMTAEFLLALPADTRLAALSEFTDDDRERPRPGRIAETLRDEVALRGLVDETRAYRRGRSAFRWSAQAGVLVDQDGRPWRMREDALESPTGERLDRIGGHLAYWFAWVAFHPDGEVYTGELQASPR